MPSEARCAFVMQFIKEVYDMVPRGEKAALLVRIGIKTRGGISLLRKNGGQTNRFAMMDKMYQVMVEMGLKP